MMLRCCSVREFTFVRCLHIVRWVIFCGKFYMLLLLWTSTVSSRTSVADVVIVAEMPSSTVLYLSFECLFIVDVMEECSSDVDGSCCVAVTRCIVVATSNVFVFVSQRTLFTNVVKLDNFFGWAFHTISILFVILFLFRLFSSFLSTFLTFLSAFRFASSCHFNVAVRFSCIFFSLAHSFVRRWAGIRLSLRDLLFLLLFVAESVFIAKIALKLMHKLQ